MLAHLSKHLAKHGGLTLYSIKPSKASAIKPSKPASLGAKWLTTAANNSSAMTEDMAMRRKLKWRSMERGMKENEIIFRSFIAKHLDTMPAEILPEFEELLDLPDPDLYKWLSGATQPPEDVAASKIWKMVSDHVKNDLKKASKGHL